MVQPLIKAGALQRENLFSDRRGEMTVLYRPALEAVSCSCYANDSRTFACLLGCERERQSLEPTPGQ